MRFSFFRDLAKKWRISASVSWAIISNSFVGMTLTDTALPDDFVGAVTT